MRQAIQEVDREDITEQKALESITGHEGSGQMIRQRVAVT